MRYNHYKIARRIFSVAGPFSTCVFSMGGAFFDLVWGKHCGSANLLQAEKKKTK